MEIQYMFLFVYLILYHLTICYVTVLIQEIGKIQFAYLFMFYYCILSMLDKDPYSIVGRSLSLGKHLQLRVRSIE